MRTEWPIFEEIYFIRTNLFYVNLHGLGNNITLMNVLRLFFYAFTTFLNYSVDVKLSAETISIMP